MKKDLHLSWTKFSDKENSDRQFLDFIIPGQRLSEYLGIKRNNSVTPFGFFQNREEENRALKEIRLQLKTQLIDNRTELYI
jgi:hypothetical protein